MIDHNVVYENLPTTIGAFVREHDGYNTIVLNARMSHEYLRKKYRHEIAHLEEDDLNKKTCSADRIEAERRR